MTTINRTCCNACNNSLVKQPVILVSSNNQNLESNIKHNILCPKSGVVNILCASNILNSQKKECPHCRVVVVGFVFEEFKRAKSSINSSRTYSLNATHKPLPTKSGAHIDSTTAPLLEGEGNRKKCCRITGKQLCCTLALSAITFLVFYVELKLR